MKQEDREFTRDLINKWLRIKKVDKMRSDYEGLEPCPRDGRLRTNLAIDGTYTGRLSSSGFFLAETGSNNLQNIAKTQAQRDPLFKLRECFIPTEGKALGASDLSSAERRLLAYLADEKRAIEWTEKGDNEFGDSSYPYKKFGANLFDDIDHWREVEGPKYTLSKLIMLALDRGIGWQKLKNRMNRDAEITGATISAQQAKEAHGLFHDLFPGYEEYFDEVAEFIADNGYVTNVLGRRHVCFERTHTKKRLKSVAKDMVSFQAQAVGDLLNKRMRQMYDELDPELVQIVLNVHDEVLFEFDPADVYEVKRKVLEIMEQPIDLSRAEPSTPHGEIVIPADFEMSTESWGVMEEV